MSVVTCWHFSVPYHDGRLHACAPGTLGEIALARLRDDDPVWRKPEVCLHNGWVVDGAHYRCRPRDRLVIWRVG